MHDYDDGSGDEDGDDNMMMMPPLTMTTMRLVVMSRVTSTRHTGSETEKREAGHGVRGKDPERVKERRGGKGYQGREPEGDGSVSAGTVVSSEMTANDSSMC